MFPFCTHTIATVFCVSEILRGINAFCADVIVAIVCVSDILKGRYIPFIPT